MNVSAPPRMLPGDMAAGRLSDDERSTILALLRGGSSYGEIRDATGRSVGSIAKVAKDNGVNAEHSAADRTRVARQARAAYSAERRAEFAARLQEEAEHLLEQMRGRYLAFNFGGKDNTYEEHELDEPPVEAKRQLMAAIREAERTILDIKKADERADESPSKGLLERLVESLEEAD